jgi:membrane-associated protease RseP (regulator of RpoE activity)
MSELYQFPPQQLPAQDFPAQEGPFYRPTLVQRLPQYVPLPSPQQEKLSFGRLLWHLTLLGLTAVTTTVMGALFLNDGKSPLLSGLIYSFALLMILGAHEMGHYIACRWYRVAATLPFFLPSPLPLFGTFGAVIKIKSPIPSRRALFDIGIAGPLAGFVFALPVAFLAHYFAKAGAPAVPDGEVIIFNDPLLFIVLAKLLHLPPHIDGNPLWFAAWLGTLMTALNLLPIGQLDGGHVVYAVFGERGHRFVARAVYLGVVALAVYSYLRGGWMGWFVWVVLLTIMMRFGHPPLLDEEEPLGLARVLVALIGLLVFVLCFMPFPITI